MLGTGNHTRVAEVGVSISTRVVISKVRHFPGFGVKVRSEGAALATEEDAWDSAEVAKNGEEHTPRAVVRNCRRTGVIKKSSG